MEGHYEVLGISPDADLEDVKSAYRSLLTEYHPDHGGSREEFIRLNEAYEWVIDEMVSNNGVHSNGHTPKTVDVPGFDSPGTPTYDPTDRDVRHDYAMTVSGELLTLSLVAVAHNRDIATLFDGHVQSTARRTLAFFRVENTCDQQITWRGQTECGFVGTDGFLYGGSNIIAPHTDRLPWPWCGTDCPIEPGRAVDAVVVTQEMPDDVAIDHIVYTQHQVENDVTVSDYDDPATVATKTERYLFELGDRVRDHLDTIPF